MDETEIEIPKQAPVMVLPNTVLFPHAPLPLYIFEPRYRAMLAWALENDRVFCIAQQRTNATGTTSRKDFYHIAGLGLIRACVGNEDGTSHLLLQGITRVRLTKFLQDEPFFLARIRPLRTTALAGPGATDYLPDVLRLVQEVRAMTKKIGERIELPEGGMELLEKVNHPDLLSDTVAHAFVRTPAYRQDLLEETDIRERLSSLLSYLREELED